MKNIDRTIYHKRAGVYIIKDSIKDRFYIGSTNDLYKRANSHTKKLGFNKHHNTFLQNHYNKYGTDCLSFEILEFIDDRNNREFIFEREQYWIDKLFSDKCFNAHNNVCFFIQNDVQRARQGVFMKQWLNEHPEHMEKLKKNLALGRTLGNETKRIKKLNGFVYKVHNKGVPTSDIVKEKQRISAIKRGRHDFQLRKVYQYDLDDNFIREWASGIDAARAITNNYKLVANIYQCCNNKRKRAMGFMWRYDKV